MIYETYLQCPVSGGKAVYKAQGMLRTVNPALQFDNKGACLQEGIQYRNLQQVNIIKKGFAFISPNPVKDKAVLHYSFPAESKGVLIINDQYGNEIIRAFIEGSSSSAELNTSALSSGIYRFRVVAGNEIESTGRFAVVK